MSLINKQLNEIKRLKKIASDLNNECLKLGLDNANLIYRLKDATVVFNLASKYVFMPVAKAVKARFKLIETINTYNETYEVK